MNSRAKIAQVGERSLGPFGDAALDLMRHGLAVLPLGGDDGKRPMVVNFNKWGLPPGEAFLRKLIGSHPDANIGIIAHLSGVTVIDIDDPDLVDQMQERFGKTPLVTRTPSGGVHFWYCHDGERNGSLRSEGLAVDIKSKNGIVAVPPSRRRTGPNAGKNYVFERGNWGDLASLPYMHPDALQKTPEATVSHLRAIKEGRRNEVLFKLLLREAHHCDDLDALIDVAHTLNANNETPLPDAEIVKTAKSAWDYEIHGNNWAGSEARVVLTATVIDRLSAENLDALVLYLVLRRNQGARPIFAVSPKPMSRDHVISNWSPRRYATARDYLLEAGLLVSVHQGGNGKHDSSQYEFGSLLKGADSSPNIIRHPPPSLSSDYHPLQDVGEGAQCQPRANVKLAAASNSHD